MNELSIDQISKVLFETASEGLIVVNKSGDILLNNDRIEEMLGYEKGELRNVKVEKIIPQKYRDEHVNHRSKYTKNPSKRSMGQGMNLTAQRKDGSVFPVEISLNYFHLDQEMLVIALVSDITKRREIENEVLQLNADLEKRVEERTAELKKSQLLYSLIARNFPNGIISVFDKKLKYIFVDGQEMYRVGVSGKALLGTYYLDRLNDEIREPIASKLNDALIGKNSTFEIQFNNNQYILNAVGLHNANNEIDQVLLVEQNITPMKKAEEEMRKALQKEKELNELKSRFVSLASHEFRTPLSSILSSVSLIQKYTTTEQQDKRDKHIERIKSSVHNLTGILNDFLSLDKLESGVISIKHTEVIPYDLVTALIDETQVLAKRGQIINLNFKGSKTLSIFMDVQMLKNIIINLISNALKYSKENQEIEVRVELNEEQIFFSVKDNGIGIPEEEQKEMFQRFFRAKNSINIQGTGLGLNIVKKYVDLLNGSISFESKLDEGTTFNVTLPIKQ